MKNLIGYSIRLVLIIVPFIGFNYCTHKSIQNVPLDSMIFEKPDTHSSYAHHYSHSFPRQPKVNDSIIPPEFIGGFSLCKDTLYSQLRKIYIGRAKKIYTDILFSIKVDENGNATEYRKYHVNTADESFKNRFMKIYPTILNNVKTWKPARLKKDNKAVEYIVYMEIRSDDGHLINIKIRTWDDETIYKGHF